MSQNLPDPRVGGMDQNKGVDQEANTDGVSFLRLWVLRGAVLMSFQPTIKVTP